MSLTTFVKVDIHGALDNLNAVAQATKAIPRDIVINISAPEATAVNQSLNTLKTTLTAVKRSAASHQCEAWHWQHHRRDQ